MAWFLNPALTRFRNEVNGRWPRRDKKSDGTVGDLAHQGTNSDHNPDPDGSVDAWDMDVDGVDVQEVINAALKHESIQYVIYNRRITSRTWGLGTWRPYDGLSPHTEHVHFNTRPSHENSQKPWFTEEDDEVDQTTFNKLMDTYAERLSGLQGTSDSQKRLRRNWMNLVGQPEVLLGIAGVDEAVVEKLNDETLSVEEQAAVLKSALGDRAQAIGQILANG